MYSFSVPSKTFIMGEYAVMQGGAGLLVGTEPRFEALVEAVQEGQEATYEGFSPQGPAMNFLKDHLEDFAKYSVRIEDPHNGKGGLGWSSAQFVLLYAIQKWIQNQEQIKDINKEDLLETFLKYAWNGEGWAPSGLDVLCHLEGGIMSVTAPKKMESKKIKSIVVEDFKRFEKWPFEGIEMGLIRTGEKVATHAHLSHLDKINFDTLSKLSTEAGKSMEAGDEEGLMLQVNAFRDALEEQNLVAPNSLRIFKLLQDRPEVLAFKGCGALGADVILVILVSELLSDFEEWSDEEGFEWIASSRNITQGLVVQKVEEA